MSRHRKKQGANKAREQEKNKKKTRPENEGPRHHPGGEHKASDKKYNETYLAAMAAATIAQDRAKSLGDGYIGPKSTLD